MDGSGPERPEELNSSGPEADSSGPATSGSGQEAIDEAPSPARRSVFSLEGRAAPGLYVAGWALTTLGILATVAVIHGDARGPGWIALAVGGLSLASFGLVAAAGAQALQRRADRVEGYAGPSPFLVFTAAFAVINLATVPIVLAGRWIGFGLASPIGVVASLAVNLAIYVLLVGLLVVGTGALTWSDMGLWRPRDPSRLSSDLVSGLVLGVPAVFVTVLLAATLVAIMGVSPEPPLPVAHSLPGFIANLVAAAILAPIGEEILFRGFATTAWARRLGPESALVRGALFFAFVHVLAISGSSFDQAVRVAAVTFISRLPIAYLLGWLFLRRRSLYASIALHSTFNGLLIVLSMLNQ